MCVRVLCGFASRGDLLTPLRTPQAVDSLRSGSLTRRHSLPQVLEALHFLEKKGLPFGNVHSGNVMCAMNFHRTRLWRKTSTSERKQTNTTTRSSTATPTRPHSRCSARFWPGCACARGVCVHGESALRLRPRGRNAMIYPRRLRRARVSACA